MTKIEFLKNIQSKLLDIRTEYKLSQEKMSDIIGVSKKTYIQLEKGRVQLKWAEGVVIATLFQSSEAINNEFGDDIIDYLQVIALQKIQKRQLPTLGGKVFWENIESNDEFTIQQQKITKHYRIIDKENYRLYFTLSKKDVMNRYLRYIGGLENE